MHDQSPNILYIHGSGQSPVSWSYIELFLPEHNALHAEYDAQEHIDSTQQDIVQLISRFDDKPFSIIAHSYGCLVAAIVAEKVNSITHLVALSPPWGGSHTAKWLGRAFRDNNFFKNTTPNSELIQRIHSVPTQFPVTNVVTTGGHNVFAGLGSKSNDGMVTVESQYAIPPNFPAVQVKEICASHSEVLLSFDVVNIIKHAVFEDYV
jgi:pimeloyl-ACP methyl ester carboxylesterase